MNSLSGGGSLPPRPSGIAIVRGFLEGAISIMFLSILGSFSGFPWLIAPFGASCVLLFAAPMAPLAQPRNVICGHVITSAAGLFAIFVLGNSFVSLSFAVGAGIALMQVTRTIHPPAGANPIVVFLAGKGAVGIGFLMSPVLIGAVALVIIAAIINNIGRDAKWPVYWVGKDSKS